MDQDVLIADAVRVDFLKPTANAKETTARGRRLRLRPILQAAGAIALLVVAGFLVALFFGNWALLFLGGNLSQKAA